MSETVTCSKRKFDRIGAALAIGIARRSKSRKRLESRSYWCAECRAWHLTKSSICLGTERVQIAAPGKPKPTL